MKNKKLSLNIKIFMLKLINFLIVLSFYAGIGLAFLFQDLSYLWISAIGLSYILFTKFNIPILSPLVRSFNWTFVKFSVFKQLKNNSMQMFPTMIYLEKEPIARKIYIQKGVKAFVEHLNHYLNNQSENIKKSFDNFSKIQEEIKNPEMEV